jgi:hypothetical protein
MTYLEPMCLKDVGGELSVQEIVLDEQHQLE